MLNPFYILIGSIIFLIYGGLNYYIGLRGWQALFSFIPIFSYKVYWSIFWLLSLSYIFSRLSQKYLPTIIYEGVAVVGAYWLAFMFYFLLVITTFDLLRLLDHFLKVIPLGIKTGLNPAVGFIVFILVAGAVDYGAWNARHPQVKHYDLTIAKQAGPLIAAKRKSTLCGRFFKKIKALFLMGFSDERIGAKVK